MGERDLHAGAFSEWLRGFVEALDGLRDAEVPCGGCSACCTSSQFVQIGPDETDTLAHVPSELLFPVPGGAPGEALLGYDEQGRCPMLRGGLCSIYAHRPRTCRAYDCRAFKAAGLRIAEPAQRAISLRAARWCFSFATEADRLRLQALRAAAGFLEEHRDRLPDEVRPRTVTQLAALAVDVHDLFLQVDTVSGREVPRRPDLEAVVERATSRRRENPVSRTAAGRAGPPERRRGRGRS